MRKIRKQSITWNYHPKIVNLLCPSTKCFVVKIIKFLNKIQKKKATYLGDVKEENLDIGERGHTTKVKHLIWNLAMKLIVETFDKYGLKWKDFLNYNLGCYLKL